MMFERALSDRCCAVLAFVLNGMPESQFDANRERFDTLVKLVILYLDRFNIGRSDTEIRINIRPDDEAKQ